VIVVEDGRMLGAGTHESLLAESSTYREFAESQSLDAEVGGPR
jgi:ATP-binding cassette subfamily B multidrug efflux pump